MHREFATIEAAPAFNAEAQDIPALIADTAYDLHRIITGFGEPSPGLAARAALLVTTHVALRDRLLRLALGHESSAGRLWTHIAAQHPGRTPRGSANDGGERLNNAIDRAERYLALADPVIRTMDSLLPQLEALVATGNDVYNAVSSLPGASTLNRLATGSAREQARKKSERGRTTQQKS